MTIQSNIPHSQIFISTIFTCWAACTIFHVLAFFTKFFHLPTFFIGDRIAEHIVENGLGEFIEFL